MKKVLEYIAYVAKVVNAISEGAKVAAEHWPVNNPFASVKGNEKVGNELQGQQNKS
jgi:aldehyde:ferredoxin oxidoreductase